MLRWAHITERALLSCIAIAVTIPGAFAQEARWKALNDQAAQLQEQGKYTEAAPIATEAEHVAEATFGPEHAITSAALNRLGSIYMEMGRYPEAEALLKRALAVGLKALGPRHPGIATMENNLAALYDDQGRYAEAEPLYKQALAIDQNTSGANPLNVSGDLNNLGLLYVDEGRYADAEPTFKQAIAIDEKASGPAGLATDLHNLALLYEKQGRYAESENLYKQALTLDEKALGPAHPSVANQLNGLAELYDQQGRYGDAEQLLKRAVDVYQKAFGPDHPTVATALNNLALLYESQGRHSEAEPLEKRALVIAVKALGPEHPSVAVDLMSLGALYEAEERYAQADPLVTRAVAIDEKALGPEHPTLAAGLNTLASLKEAEGQYTTAEPLYQRAMAINVKALGAQHPSVAVNLNNLGACYKNEGRYPEAEQFYKRAIAIDEKALGPDHPQVATFLLNLALLYEAWGKNGEAAPAFEQSLDITHKRFEYGFAYMSEKDRLEFLASLQNMFPAYFSFSLAQEKNDAGTAGKVYDVLLWEKGLVGTSVAALRAQVANSGDPQAVKMLDDLTAKKNESSRLATARPAGWAAAQSNLDADASELEQQLARRVSSFGEQNALAQAKWQDVQKTLQPGDAAVEVVRFQFHDGKKFTTTFYYAALVMTRDAPRPAFVVLGEAQKLETAPVAAYRAEVVRTRGVVVQQPQPGTGGETTTDAYNAFWKPLQPALAGAKRVYLAPDGVLNQLPIGLFTDESGRLLLEKYDLRIVNSTKDLLRPARAASSKAAVLLGNPKFALSEQEQRMAVSQLNSGELKQPASATSSASVGTRSGVGAGGPLPPLPSTQIEIEKVGGTLKAAGWQVRSYTGNEALEEVIDRLRSPRVVHVATHGFFLSDQEMAQKETTSPAGSRGVGMEDPMLRSGLFFAGADRAAAGAAPAAGLDDGVLTAYQAAQLDLQGTELVVLSACETGLGEQKNGEGVFGLRRGLQEAGAESVLMSMWSVPDQETQELMALFYQKWLGGVEKHEALRQAQIQEREVVRQRYAKDLPFYWGAFVLIGR